MPDSSASHTQNWTWLTLLLTTLAGATALGVLRIQQIQCQLEDRPCPAEVASVFEELKGHSVFFISPKLETISQPITTFFKVENYSINLPSTLVVTVRTQTPLYQIKKAETQEFLVVNQAGQVMATQQQEQVMTFVLSDAVWDDVTGDASLSPSVHQKLTQIRLQLDGAGLGVTRLYAPDTSTLVIYLTNGQVVLADQNDISTSLTRLDLIADHLQAQPSDQVVNEIDVRFEFPVLRETINVPRHDAL